MAFKRVRYFVFLKDIFGLATTAFGGAQAHLAHFQRVLVKKRAYLSEQDLMEIYSLCQVLPGPTSTQVLTAVGFRVGGAWLAYLTLLVWAFPAVLVMTISGMVMAGLERKSLSMDFARFIQPMAVGFVSYSAYTISLKTIHSKIGLMLMILSGLVAYFIQSPFLFPFIILLAGLVTSFNYKDHPREEKDKFNIEWANFFLWAGVFLGAALLGHFTRALPIRLFENFYRNGSLIFGGGHMLTPLLYTEFVQYAPKQYLTSEEFLSGYAISQALPGPVFSFSAFVGGLSMREYGPFGEILGSFMAAAGIFLPGTFLIFFVIRFWEILKKYRVVRASIEGITAASSGLVASAAIIMFQPLENNAINFGFTLGTFGLLAFTKIPPPLIIFGGLVLGLIL